MQAALRAADAGALVRSALADPALAIRFRAAIAVDLIAAGKAASPMRQSFLAGCGAASVRNVMATGTEAGHPLPNEASLDAARRALAIASAAADTDLLVVLLSGGASAQLAMPAAGLTLADKQATADRLLKAGADIYALNTVRKHLSAIKGGRLAAGTAARVMTLAISDVIGDDLSVIGSGPTVPDRTTFADALRVLDTHGGRDAFPPAVARRLDAGARGELPETPKPGDARFSQALTRIIGNRFTAMEGARLAAEAMGYAVTVVEEPTIGDARAAGRALARHETGRGRCLIASGETTVHVTGSGTGGRNQELALAMAAGLAAAGGSVVAASVATDGIDGPTDAAGALVDATTLARARTLGLDPEAYLRNNDAFAFFERLDDLIRTGPTGTNVGDLQIILTA